MRRIKGFFLNALILTAVSFIMRTVGMAFNVYVSNRVGAEAMGLYSLISTVYGFAVTLATSGINLAVVRLVSEAMGSGENKAVKGVMRRAFCHCLFFGGLSLFIVYFFSEAIGIGILCDERTVLSLKIFAFSLPFIALSSAFHGYFTAVRKAYKNALVSMGEQLIKIFTVAWLLNALLPSGIEYACVALVLGGAFSEVLSCLAVAFLWLIERRSTTTDGKSHVRRRSLLGISLPVAFSAYARSALLTVEHALIPRGLKKSGVGHGEALAAYGVVHSMAFPIIMFPSAFIYSFSGLLVPELAECKENCNRTQIRYIASRVFQFSLMFSIGVAGIMMTFADEIGRTIYPNMGVEGYIRLLAPLIPVMYTDGTVDAMLKGLGHQVFSMNVNIFDATLSVVLVWILLPHFGIYGYIITLFVCEILNASLSVTRTLSSIGIRPRVFRWIFQPMACIAGAAGITRALIYFVIGGEISTLWALIICMTITVAIYIVLLRLTSTLSTEDARWLRGIFFKKASDTVANRTA
ncbi:MAG: oligosaccharide flippase family protein [Clostridia bacterium]|nr:oligosaccharide flippase family protein [Clostridia bacterium]